jgi:deoxycytidylate deaminase
MIKLPYIYPGRKIKYVPISNKWIQKAKEITNQKSGCSYWPTGAVIVKDNKVISSGWNNAKIVIPCERYVRGCKTGEGYELCNQICKRVGYGHAEYTAVEVVKKEKND